jgi:hypothetical protein
MRPKSARGRVVPTGRVLRWAGGRRGVGSNAAESCLHRSLKLADIDDDVRPAATSGESGRVLLVRSARSYQWPMASEGAYETKTQTTPNCVTGTLTATW